MARIYENLADTFGNTPLVKLPRLTKDLAATVLVKMESFNPAGSVKDRIGVAMIEAAERDGRLLPGMTILEPTSGNTGIALAFVAAAKGYPLILVMPDTMTIERRNLLKAYGAQVVLTPGAEGMPGAIRTRERDSRRRARTSISCRSSSRIRRIPRSTAARRPKKFGAIPTAPSTSSSPRSEPAERSPASARCSKTRKPGVQIIAVEPDASPVLSGGKPGPHKIQGTGAGFVPKVLNTTIYDEVIRVTDADAIATARRLAREEGMLVGISSGANVWAALQVAARPESRGKTIVTIGCDTGERYLSNPVFAEQEATIVEPALV